MVPFLAKVNRIRNQKAAVARAFLVALVEVALSVCPTPAFRRLAFEHFRCRAFLQIINRINVLPARNTATLARYRHLGAPCVHDQSLCFMIRPQI